MYGNGPSLLSYHQGDWLGSIRMASNPNQTVGNDEAYAPFGEQYANTGTTTMFTGQWNMVQTDYEDFLSRKYHFIQGRWLSPDPAGLKAVHLKNPQSWNRYAYVMNNPLAWVDPQGLEDCLFTRVHRMDEDPGGCGEGGSSIDVGSDGGGGDDGTVDGDDEGDGSNDDPSGNDDLPCYDGNGQQISCNDIGPGQQVSVTAADPDALPPGVADAFAQVGQNTESLESPWFPVVWYGTPAAVTLGIEYGPGAATALATSPALLGCATDFIQGFLPGPVTSWCGAAGQIVSNAFGGH